MSNTVDIEDTTLDPKLRSLLEDSKNDKDYVYCAQCSAVLTQRSEQTIVNGSHDHRCTNPHGFAFHIGCYNQALGCTISGGSHAADSWFMGYTWELATCAECHCHLGWYFSKSDHNFYGLILKNIQFE